MNQQALIVIILLIILIIITIIIVIIFNEGTQSFSLVFLKVFPGNRDHYSIKENSFDPPFRSRFVRMYARTWVNHISMRLEFYGGRACKCYFTIFLCLS